MEKDELAREIEELKLCKDDAAGEVGYFLPLHTHADILQALRPTEQAKALTEQAVGEANCPSCGGLNTACPDGCGRDPLTGELNGTRYEAVRDEQAVGEADAYLHVMTYETGETSEVASLSAENPWGKPGVNYSAEYPVETTPLYRLRQATPAPEINAVFETRDGPVIGTTEAKVKRVERQDDGSLTVVIDYWPAPDEGLRELLRKARGKAKKGWHEATFLKGADTPAAQALFRALDATIFSIDRIDAALSPAHGGSTP